MSLIQQALDKTSRAQQTRTTNSDSLPRAWVRDPMGASLEQKLIQVQQAYGKRRGLYWKVALGVLLVCFAAVLTYVGVRQNHSDAKASSVTAAARMLSQVPVKIFSGNIYRLTGITNIGDKAIAVINNRLVGVGDALDGRAVVKAIGKGEVRLDVQGKEIDLTL